jgi:hypothetical protein
MDLANISVDHVRFQMEKLLVARDMGGYDASLEAVWDQETKEAQTFGREGCDNTQFP